MLNGKDWPACKECGLLLNPEYIKDLIRQVLAEDVQRMDVVDRFAKAHGERLDALNPLKEE